MFASIRLDVGADVDVDAGPIDRQSAFFVLLLVHVAMRKVTRL